MEANAEALEGSNLMSLAEDIDPQFEELRGDFMLKLNELCEKNEDHLAIVLNSHLYVEQCLMEAVRRKLPHPELLGDRLKFIDYLDLAGALGAAPREHMPAYRALNVLRNRIAHRFGFDPTPDDIAKLKGAFDSRLLQMLSRHEKFRGSTRLSDAVLCIVTAAGSILIGERFLSAADELASELSD